LKKFSAQVIEPQAIPLIAFPKAWSPGFEAPLTAEVVYVDARTEADLEKFKGTLKGKIVFTAPVREVAAHFQPQGTRLNEKELLALADAPEPRPTGGGRNFQGNPTARAAALFINTKMRFFDQEGAALLVDPARGDGGTIFVQSASIVPPVSDPNTPTTGRGTPSYDKSKPKVIPQMVLAIEHYNRIVRMLQAGEKVKINVDLGVAWQEADLMGRDAGWSHGFMALGYWSDRQCCRRFSCDGSRQDYSGAGPQTTSHHPHCPLERGRAGTTWFTRVCGPTLWKHAGATSNYISRAFAWKCW
jgi:hypothetical protein